jgi:glycosyltransferase involved in cell wall biosynthesis
MNNKRVLLLITGLNMGGAEVQVSLLAQSLVKIGWSVAVVSLIPPRYFVEDLQKAGVEVFSLDMKAGKPSLSALCKFYRIHKTWKPDVVHSHMYHATLFARCARALFFWFTPLISTAHNIDETEGSQLRYFLYRSTRYLTTFMTNVSKVALDHYAATRLVVPKRSAHIPNGVRIPDSKDFDLRRNLVREKLEVEEGTFLWLSAGRLVPAKDYKNLLAAAKILDAAGLEFLICIAGEGPERSFLEGELRNLGLASKVKLLGIRRDLEDLLVASDAFVLSSAWEGLPMVILEAMSVGKVVVATDVGGVRELVSAETGGTPVEAANPAALAKEMAMLMELPRTVRERRGLEGARFVGKSFGMDQLALRWSGLYEDHSRLPSKRGLP